MSFSQLSSLEITDSDSQDIEMPDSDTVEYSNPPVLEISSPEEESLDLSDPELYDPELEDSELDDFSSFDSLHSELTDPELHDSELVDLELIEQVSNLDLEDSELSFPSTPEKEPNLPLPAPPRIVGIVTQVWRGCYMLKAWVEIPAVEILISFITWILDSVYTLASMRHGLWDGISVSFAVSEVEMKWRWRQRGVESVARVISRTKKVFFT